MTSPAQAESRSAKALRTAFCLRSALRQWRCAASVADIISHSICGELGLNRSAATFFPLDGPPNTYAGNTSKGVMRREAGGFVSFGIAVVVDPSAYYGRNKWEYGPLILVLPIYVRTHGTIAESTAKLGAQGEVYSMAGTEYERFIEHILVRAEEAIRTSTVEVRGFSVLVWADK